VAKAVADKIKAKNVELEGKKEEAQKLLETLKTANEKRA